jgi:hypothetical protein
LLELNCTILLFPGGVREAYHRKGEDYKLFWPEKADFVRVAAKFNATIVPFGAVGCADAFNMLLDNEEIVNLPIIGENLKTMNSKLPVARPRQESDELFVPPLSVPRTAARFYFLFGKVRS